MAGSTNPDATVVTRKADLAKRSRREEQEFTIVNGCFSENLGVAKASLPDRDEVSSRTSSRFVGECFEDDY